MMSMNKEILVIGVDFGTDSCRALIVNANTGEELATSTSIYKRWVKGLYSDPTKSQYRHHPMDYIESLREVLYNVISMIPSHLVQHIKAIGIDATASTVCLTDNNGIPLALQLQYANNPNAMFLLWKD